jgi:hypothetical protein
MKPQASIEQIAADPPYFIVKKPDQKNESSEQFSDYQQALDFILKQGWQLKRDKPNSSLHVETRFLKP